jgi:hypothetical protein
MVATGMQHVVRVLAALEGPVNGLRFALQTRFLIAVSFRSEPLSGLWNQALYSSQ